MKYAASIAERAVCSDQPFIVFSPTKGVINWGDTFEDASRSLGEERACCAERGKESDAAVFHWAHDEWVVCGSLYDIETSEWSTLLTTVPAEIRDPY
jgi:hypothetical protein